MASGGDVAVRSTRPSSSLLYMELSLTLSSSPRAISTALSSVAPSRRSISMSGVIGGGGGGAFDGHLCGTPSG